MRTSLLLVLLASFSFAGGQKEGSPSSLAKIVDYMKQEKMDTLKFNNQKMVIIVKMVDLDSTAIEKYACGLDKDSTKNDAASSQLIPIPPIEPSKVKRL